MRVVCVFLFCLVVRILPMMLRKIPEPALQRAASVPILPNDKNTRVKSRIEIPKTNMAWLEYSSELLTEKLVTQPLYSFALVLLLPECNSSPAGMYLITVPQFLQRYVVSPFL